MLLRNFHIGGMLVPLLATACGGSSGQPAEGELRVLGTRDLLREATSPGSAAGETPRHVLWLDGTVRLQLAWTEGAEPLVRQREEGGAESTLFGLRGPSTARRASVSVTKDRPGPLDVRFEIGGGAWESILLEELADEVAPSERSLAGALAGRDVLLVVADSRAAAHLSSYGAARPTSPTLDRLAREGVRFETAYSQTSWTLSSIGSLFTSLEQERHGVLRMEDKLPAELTTLAELFQRAGWRTAGLVQNTVVAAHTQLDQGFELYEEFPYTSGDLEAMLARARELLLAPAEKPLFLYLHLSPPHQPYRPPSPFLERFADPSYAGPVDGSVLSCARLNQEKPARDHADVRQLEALYDANVAWADAALGTLLDELADAGREDHLFVVATADHGEAFLEHGVQGHNAHVYEEMVRIPLILRARGVLPEGLAPRAPVGLLDLLPTLVEACDLGPVPGNARGTSLLPLLATPQRELARPLYFTSRYREDPAKLQRAVRAGSYKLVVREGASALYDLSPDPGETRDLSAELPLHAEALRSMLERWHAEALLEGTAAPSAPLEESVREDIEALGYGGDDDDEGG